MPAKIQCDNRWCCTVEECRTDIFVKTDNSSERTARYVLILSPPKRRPRYSGIVTIWPHTFQHQHTVAAQSRQTKEAQGGFRSSVWPDKLAAGDYIFTHLCSCVCVCGVNTLLMNFQGVSCVLAPKCTCWTSLNKQTGMCVCVQTNPWGDVDRHKYPGQSQQHISGLWERMKGDIKEDRGWTRLSTKVTSGGKISLIKLKQNVDPSGLQSHVQVLFCELTPALCIVHHLL